MIGKLDEDLSFYSQGNENGQEAYQDPFSTQSKHGYGYSQPPDFMMGSAEDMHPYDEDEAIEDPPLLEEMGIDLQLIASNTFRVLLPFRISKSLAENPDLAGPLLYCILLGFLLLLNGKVHFGYIYGMGLVGCLGIYMILNLMSKVDLDIHKIVSVLGYCMLPIVILSLISIPLDLSEGIGFIVAVIAIVWATFSATSFMETIFDMREQRYLIAYPIGMLYTCFALLTIF